MRALRDFCRNRIRVWPQDARQKAIIVFPRIPVLFSTSSSILRFEIVRIRLHLASRFLVRRAVKAEFTNSQSTFGAHRRSKNTAGHRS